MGEQELPLPYWSSANHHVARRSVPGVVFWYRHGGHSSPYWFVPPRLARAQWPKTHHSSLPHLCPGRAGQTHVDQNPLLPSFRRRSHATRDLELVKAVEKGYTLVKIHEVWHFPPGQRRTGLFKDYVNTWLKLKQESAGWPSWCQTVEQKRNYILRYQEREGIRLDIASIAKNPGRKATAKLMLISFWGKFG